MEHGRGGGAVSSLGLCLANFVWVAEGPALAGLAVDQEQLAELRSQIEVTQPLRAEEEWTGRLLFPARGARHLEGIAQSEAFRQRQAEDPSYWPEHWPFAKRSTAHLRRTGSTGPWRSPARGATQVPCWAFGTSRGAECDAVSIAGRFAG